MKIQKLKAALKSLLIEFRSVNTDKAVLSWDGEEDIKEGISVYITDEEGNRSIPEDGEYIDEEKTKYVIESGIVKQIIPLCNGCCCRYKYYGTELSSLSS